MAKKVFSKRTLDYGTSIARYVSERSSSKIKSTIQAHVDYSAHVKPVCFQQNDVAQGFLTRYAHTSYNKERSSINCVTWAPNARRVITGSHKGELTLWSGIHFSYEMTISAHEAPIRYLKWTPNSQLLLSGDDSGTIHYWKPNMENVRSIKAHTESIHAITFSKRSHQRVATGSDDRLLIVRDLETGMIQEQFNHESEIKSADWHPYTDILMAGTKDGQVKLWDVRQKPSSSFSSFTKSAHTLKRHNGGVMRVAWHRNGVWFLTASRDQTIRQFDLRFLPQQQQQQPNYESKSANEWGIDKGLEIGLERGQQAELSVYTGHKREITALAWHPQIESLFATGGADGNIFYWLANHSSVNSSVNSFNTSNNCDNNSLSYTSPVAQVCGAHDNSVLDLAWHPLGHLIASAGFDYSMKMWTRNRPGDDMRDQHNANQLNQDTKYQALLEIYNKNKNRASTKFCIKTAFTPHSNAQRLQVLEGFDAWHEQVQLSERGSASYIPCLSP